MQLEAPVFEGRLFSGEKTGAFAEEPFFPGLKFCFSPLVDLVEPPGFPGWNQGNHSALLLGLFIA